GLHLHVEQARLRRANEDERHQHEENEVASDEAEGLADDAAKFEPLTELSAVDARHWPSPRVSTSKCTRPGQRGNPTAHRRNHPRPHRPTEAPMSGTIGAPRGIRRRLDCGTRSGCYGGVMNLEDAERLIAASPDHRLLKRVPPVSAWGLPSATEIGRAHV